MTDREIQNLADVCMERRAAQVIPVIVRMGIFLVRSPHGYGVMVDGMRVTDPQELAWKDADRLAVAIAARRPRGDERGYGRLGGAPVAFNSEECLLTGITTPAVLLMREWDGDQGDHD